MREPGQLERLQPLLLGLLAELSVRGVLERLAACARTLVGASEAEVRLSAPDWAPLALSSSGSGQQQDDPPGRSVAAAPDPGPGSDPAGPDLLDPPGAGGGAVLSVRVRAKGVDLGELVLWGKADGAFTAGEVELVAALAEAAGTAAWNARLYEESQGRELWLDAAVGVTADLVQGRPAAAGREFDMVAARALRASRSVLAVVAVPDGALFRIAAAAGTVPSQTFLAALAGRFRQPSGHAQEGDAGQWFGRDAAQGLGPVLAVRLPIRSTPGSLLVLARAAGSGYTRSEVSAAALFAAHAGLALDLRTRGSEAVSADRRRIARNLQEAVLPRILGAGLGLRSLQPLAPAPGAAVRIEEIARQLETAAHDVRKAAAVLGSPDAPQQAPVGFSAALLEEVAAVQADLEVQVAIQGDIDAVPAEAGDRLLAVAAEVLSAVQDAPAGTRLSLTVSVNRRDAELVVQDGVRAAQDSGPSRLAGTLAAVASRILGATYTARGAGPRLTCTVPLAASGLPGS